MNQTTIGKYIARKRKEQNLTQEQLAQQPGVSNKTIYKWENGKCMPDYSIIHKLCDALHVTRPELMDGEDPRPSAPHAGTRTSEGDPLWRRAYHPRHCQQRYVGDGRRDRCAGFHFRHPDGALRRGNSGGHWDRRKKASETVKKPAACAESTNVKSRMCGA